jgi:hypothetical protein
VRVDEPEPNVLDEMKAKIDSEDGKRIYARRPGIVETVFANICVQKRMSRFTLRSKTKVDVQWRLFALVAQYRENPDFWGIPLAPQAMDRLIPAPFCP